MTRFLGLDGPWGSLGVDWVDMWNDMLSMNDLVNANTGAYMHATFSRFGLF